MDTKEQLKHLLLTKNMTMTELCRKMSQRLNKDYTIHNISGKLKRNTIKYNEIIMLYDILGYELVVREKQNRQYFR